MIVSFTPTSGAVGANVQIEGVGFGATIAGNTVRFNGVSATILSASATEIIAEVPAGATTGPIQVTTAGGSTTTSQSFTVLPNSNTPGVAWTTRLAAPHSAGAGLAYNGTKFVSVGDSIFTSTDLRRWDERDTLLSLNSVQWDGRSFVAVGTFGDIFSSSDGLVWTSRANELGEDLSDIATSGSLWVAVGDSGTVRTSPDGVTWTTRSSTVSANLRKVAWTGTQFVAVGEQGTVITSPDGITWTSRNSGTTNGFTALGATSSLVVATTFPTTGQAEIRTSPDGVTWTAQPSGNGLGIFNAVINAGGQWVAVGSNNVVATSPDGVNWTAHPGAVIGGLNALRYTGTEYVAIGVAVGDGGSVYTSADGVTWTRHTIDEPMQAIARSGADGRLVAVTLSDVSLTSTDGGLTWSFGGLNSLVGNLFLDVQWTPALNAFVALVSEGAGQGAYSSTDGMAWTRLAAVPRSGSLAASSTLLVDAGAGGISTSPDGVTWTTRLTISPSSLQDVVWTGTQFVAVGNSGAVYTSPDGVTWTPRTSNVTTTLFGVGTSDSLLVAVGSNGTMVTSSDGVTWTARSSGTFATLRHVAWTGAEFVAVGDGGTAVRSTDGASWSVQATPYSTVLFGADPFNLKDLVWNGSDRLVIVGTRGLVATSP
ncbi:MAG: IPT/TIG domain-containing protein [Sulfurifustaceae bacterium]